MKVLRQPLFRLLAINFAIGASAAVVLTGGLLALNSGGLRDLILADRDPAVALSLLLSGFLITFGSLAMGTAIMALGRGDGAGGARRQAEPAAPTFRRSAVRR